MKLELKIRRLVIQIDEIHQEMQKNVDPPARKALAAGVFHNPYAGRYVEDLEPMFDLGAEIGGLRFLPQDQTWARDPQHIDLHRDYERLLPPGLFLQEDPHFFAFPDEFHRFE